jgi:uncharacterized protein (TIGR03437 family)
VSLKLVRPIFFSVLAIGGLSSLEASPMLRLVSATVGPVSIAPGGNGVNQTVEAYNAGDGTLSLTLSSSATWIVPTVGAAAACTTTTAAKSCVPLVFALNTASLAASATPYTGIVTVTAPNTVDAPQTITITVLIGGAVPPSVNVYVPPYVAPPAQASTVGVPFTLGAASCPPPGLSPYLNGCLSGKSTTQDGANWLSLTLSGAGSFMTTLPYMINITPQPSNAAGTAYTGSIVTSGSSFAPDNKTIAVTMNVTTQPIAQPSVTQVTEQLAVGAPVGYAAVTMTNSGLGTLTVSAVGTGSATTSGSTQWLTPTTSGNTVLLAFDPTGLAAGTYTQSVTIQSNAVNSPTVIPVTFQVVAAGAPTVFYDGAVDDAVFGGSGFSVTPGDVIALFGSQLSFAAATAGPQPPLATSLGGAAVYVNGEQAPLYFSSYGQINFQMPTDTPTGTSVIQVVTNGQNSNVVSVQVAPRAPRLLLLYGTGGYGAIVDASQGNGYNTLPMPSSVSEPGFITKPASRGDVLTIYAIGLGPTSPSVATGQPAPATEPLARLTVTPTVVFSVNRGGVEGQTSVPPQSVAYAGLSPNYAGLYQVNAAIPQDCPEGMVQVSLVFPDSTSNTVNIQVQ